jgi:quercetin dioxygenase-like cupin family protein
MRTLELAAVAKEQLAHAREADSARSSETLLGGHDAAMRQTLIALAGGAEMSEHVNPGQASIVVLEGEIEVHAGTERTQVGRGEFVELPPEPHSVRALSDSAFLLTAVPRGHIS